MQDEEAAIDLEYLPDETQVDDRVLAVRHQAHENYRMIYATAWDRVLNRARTAASLFAAAAGAIAWAVWFKFVRPQLLDPGLTLALGVIAVTIVIWSILRAVEMLARNANDRTFATWTIAADRMSGPVNVHLSPGGVRVSGSSATIEATWAHYHAAVAQPDNLILIFQGFTLVIPNSALPAGDIVKRINRWAEANAIAYRPG